MSLAEHGPFFGPVLGKQERGAILFKQTWDYKVEDGLALIELARAVPREAWERVDFFPIEAQAQLVFKLGELLPRFHQRLSGEKREQERAAAKEPETTAIAAQFDEMVAFKDWWPTPETESEVYGLFKGFYVDKTAERMARKRGDLEVPAATNVLIVGRPQYFASWWRGKALAGADREKWPRDWFKMLVRQAGYPSRFALPFSPSSALYSEEDALYDRKWGVFYKPQPSESEQSQTIEEDYALVFHNRVKINGIARRITICTGLGALGTWAAARFVADPGFWSKLQGCADLADDEGPLDIALRVRMDPAERAWPLGPYRLDFNHIVEILNNDPSEYLGQVCQLEDIPPIHCHVAQTMAGHRCLDLARPIKAFRVLMDGSQELLQDLDPTLFRTLHGEMKGDDEFLQDFLGGDSAELWKRMECLRPRFVVNKVDSDGRETYRVEIRNSYLTWRDPQGNEKWLGVGPHLYLTLLDILTFILREKEARKRPPYRPLLLLGDSGAGKGPVVSAIRSVWAACSPEGCRVSAGLHELNAAEEGARLPERMAEALGDFQDEWGSLFVDEFSELTPQTQSQLLPLLQDGKLFPKGMIRGRHSGSGVEHKALVIAATSRLLSGQGENALVLPDLLNRFHQVRMAPLGERAADALVLLAHYWHNSLKEKKPIRLTAPALKFFLNHDFEGNVRELTQEIAPRLLREKNASPTTTAVDFKMMQSVLKPWSKRGGEPISVEDGSLPILEFILECDADGTMKQYGLMELIERIEKMDLAGSTVAATG